MFSFERESRGDRPAWAAVYTGCKWIAKSSVATIPYLCSAISTYSEIWR